MQVNHSLTSSAAGKSSQHLVPISGERAEELRIKFKEAVFEEFTRQGYVFAPSKPVGGKVEESKTKQNAAEAEREQIKVANEKILSGQAKQAAGKQKLQENDVKRQQILTAKFYLIFNINKKSDLTAKKIDALFAAYLADGCIVIEKRVGKSVMVIKSWEGVVKYLSDNLKDESPNNPKITSCDFSEFIIETNDTSKLTKLLTASDSLIGKITYKGAIPHDVDNALKAAKLARRGSLEIDPLQG